VKAPSAGIGIHPFGFGARPSAPSPPRAFEPSRSGLLDTRRARDERRHPAAAPRGPRRRPSRGDVGHC